MCVCVFLKKESDLFPSPPPPTGMLMLAGVMLCLRLQYKIAGNTRDWDFV